MKTIKDVDYVELKGWASHCRFIKISHSKGKILLYLCNNEFKVITNEEDFKNLDYSVHFEEFPSLSKDELEKVQKIILFAYVFLYDRLDEAVKNSKSKKFLDDIKKKILDVRKFLQNITNYIDNYENLLKEYKDI